ncbi:hypothetical protein D3C78_1714420 [compost metagenome]
MCHVSSIILEGLTSVSFVAFNLAIWIISIAISYPALFIGQQRRASAKIAVIAQVIPGFILPANQAMTIYIEGLWSPILIKLHKHLT